MVSFDLSFRSMLIEEIFEDEVALCTKGRISCLSIIIGSYHGKKVQVFNDEFRTCVSVLSGSVNCQSGSRRILSIWLPFCVF